ncbi:hypothetical protein HU200_065204 [Digitaria exilis]|uniref:Reverse transcriptase zinc-binding domain-containing protein n=1 Tax=Digitaria exilis TaxID=1010633 RepID=A0A835DY32_9POAL|nr:hypothetical protein HU200_065204 [Digitaria exilis]
MESSSHLFFNCVVAKCMWYHISQAVGANLGDSFESIGSKWLSNKKYLAINMITSAALWGLWKLRNDFCFQNAAWRDMNYLLKRILQLAQNWIILCPQNRVEELKSHLSKISTAARSPGMLTWRTTR